MGAALLRLLGRVEPPAEAVVEQDGHGGDRPGDGVAGLHSQQGVVGGHDGEQPQQPQAAHPEDRDEHGGYRLARPPDGSSEQLDENIGDIAGGQEAHHLHPHLQYVGVGGEDGQQGPGQQEKGRAEQDAEARRHGHRHPDALFQALILPGAVVLPGKGGDGLGHGGNGHPENDIHLAVGGPGGHSVGAKGVDGGLYDEAVASTILMVLVQAACHMALSFTKGIISSVRMWGLMNPLIL